MYPYSRCYATLPATLKHDANWCTFFRLTMPTHYDIDYLKFNRTLHSKHGGHMIEKRGILKMPPVLEKYEFSEHRRRQIKLTAACRSKGTQLSFYILLWRDFLWLRISYIPVVFYFLVFSLFFPFYFLASWNFQPLVLFSFHSNRMYLYVSLFIYICTYT